MWTQALVALSGASSPGLLSAPAHLKPRSTHCKRGPHLHCPPLCIRRTRSPAFALMAWSTSRPTSSRPKALFLPSMRALRPRCASSRRLDPRSASASWGTACQALCRVRAMHGLKAAQHQQAQVVTGALPTPTFTNTHVLVFPMPRAHWAPTRSRSCLQSPRPSAARRQRRHLVQRQPACLEHQRQPAYAPWKG